MIAPITNNIPALRVRESILLLINKKNTAVTTSKTNEVPQIGKMQIIILSASNCRITVPIFQKEKTKKIIQMIMQRGFRLRTQFRSNLLAEISCMTLKKDTTQKTCPTKNENAPIAKRAKPNSCNSRKISPIDPKARPITNNFTSEQLCLTVRSQIINIQIGNGFANLRTVMLQCAGYPIIYKMPKIAQRISIIMQKYILHGLERRSCQFSIYFLIIIINVNNNQISIQHQKRCIINYFLNSIYQKKLAIL